MYAGRIVEMGRTEDVFTNPLHPYTQGLIRAFPRLRGPRHHLLSIPGVPPIVHGDTAACRFEPRCPYAELRCRQSEPGLAPTKGSHSAACWFTSKVTQAATQGTAEEHWLAFESSSSAEPV